MANQTFEQMKAGFLSSERYEELLTLCIKNARENDPQSDIEIGRALLLYKPQSPDIVIHFRKAADEGDTFAMYLLGVCYKYGIGTEADEDTATEWFCRAANLDHTQSAIHAAMYYECMSEGEGPDYCSAFDLYLSAAHAGNIIAQFKVGHYFEHGNGVEIDYMEAFKWCKMAAEGGNIRAMTTLGRYYENGIGTEKSIPEAIHCYELAAAERNIPAQYALHRLKQDYSMSKPAVLYSEAYEKMKAELERIYGENAVKTAYSAENANNPVSLFICGLMANAVKRFCAYAYDFAFECFIKAALLGSVEAMWYAADYYMSGKYTQRSYKRAFELFKKAADKGYIPAYWALGFFADVGLCVEKDSEKALNYYKKAAEAGYNPSLVTLAIMYETGYGVEQNYEESQKYYASVSTERDITEPWSEVDKFFYYVNGSDTMVQYRIYRYEEIRTGDSSKFFGAYTRLAESGNVYAICRLARMYENGTAKSVKRPERAFYFYKKANDAGYEPGKRDFERFCEENPTVVAKYYSSTESSEESSRKAFEIYLTAAQTGDANAMLQTAKCYMDGCGVNADEAEGYKWAVRARHEGETVPFDIGMHVIEYPDGCREDELLSYLLGQKNEMWAQFALGMCCKAGLCTDKDDKKAAALFNSSAKGDYRWAHFELAKALENGCGIRKNMNAAFEKYFTALTENDPVAIQHFYKNYPRYHEMYETSPSDELLCLLAFCKEKGFGTEKNTEESFDIYRELADKGYMPAIYRLGRCLEYGVGIDADETQAYELYKTAAGKSYPNAMCEIGKIYEYGKIGQKQPQKALLWYKAASDLNFTYAVYCTGRLHYETDKEKGLFYLQKAADNENAEAQLHLGMHYESIGDTEKALSLYNRSSYGGNTDADVMIGKSLLRSSDPIDRKTAFDIFSKAARKGNSEAMLQSAECIARGIGVQKNPSGAVKFYIRAAQAGNMKAQYSLGSCYERGFGTDVDLKKAVEYYSMAAQQGHDDAQYALGSCYAKGKGIEQNMQMAVYWYSEAVKKGNDKAGTALGICYENGQGGLTPDMDRAIELYTMSAEKGNYIAQYRLGMCYEKGKGVEEDPVMAFMWYERSAQAGNSIAQYKVGECCEMGYGTEKDMALAVEWYKKAAQGKSEEAAYKLGVCYEYGYGVERNRQIAAEWYRRASQYSATKSRKNNTGRKN